MTRRAGAQFAGALPAGVPHARLPNGGVPHAGVLLAIALLGCGTASPPPVLEPTSVDAPTPQDATAESPADSFATMADTLGVAEEEEEIGPRLASAPSTPQAPTPLPRLVEGFRVQLFQSTSLRLAEEFRDNVAPQLGEPTYVEYEAPLYKVRAGNFRLRAEAEAWAGRLSSRGFQRVDVVGTLVDVGAPRPAGAE